MQRAFVNFVVSGGPGGPMEFGVESPRFGNGEEGFLVNLKVTNLGVMADDVNVRRYGWWRSTFEGFYNN